MKEKQNVSNRMKDLHSDDRDQLNELMELITTLSIPEYCTSYELTFVEMNSG
jgi:hypothetical protein